MGAIVRQMKAKGLQTQEPIRSENPIFLIGKNSRGNWVVQDQNGLCGGLFIGQAAALKFALTENGNHPEAVRVVPGILELDIAASPRAAKCHDAVPARSSSSRQAAHHPYNNRVKDRVNSPGC
jgi:hypothetical protein